MGILGIFEGLILGAGLMLFFKSSDTDYEDTGGYGWSRNTPSESEGMHPIICPHGTTVGHSEKLGRWVCCDNPVEYDGIFYCEKTNSPTILSPGSRREPRLLEPSTRPRTDSLVKNVVDLYPTLV